VTVITSPRLFHTIINGFSLKAMVKFHDHSNVTDHSIQWNLSEQ
jgi:hypothetical protein